MKLFWCSYSDTVRLSVIELHSVNGIFSEGGGGTTCRGPLDTDNFL